ncbi:MAG: type II CRISPR-associated endonuclease Cas1 [Streptococcaceae bacterium]|jgi:CRISPR-associated endonuclease Cas1 subtype II|nr:type II CRISPR-associated endonuclease Cas1 [Streptococcaceae bacterium]
MSFRTVTVNTHCKLSYKNNHLIFKSAEHTESIHIPEVDVLILETTDIALTTMLMAKLIEENVLVIFCDEKHLPSSMVTPFYARHDSSLQLAKQIAWDEEKKASVWTEIIRQKIANQQRFLEFQHFEKQAGQVEEMLSGLELFDPSNREGHAARTYFGALFGTKFSREQENSINAGLDYGYTLLMSVFAREIVKCGCMTQLGLKHVNQFNEFNLASDLMEPFRPLVDTIVYREKQNSFDYIKRYLFEIFEKTYSYRGQEMYLTNIAQDYVKRVIDCLHGEKKEVPEFRL